MCVLICKPAGKELPPEYMRHSNERNHDGIGIAWLDGKRIRMWKNVDSKKIDKAIQVMKALKDYPALMHFRFATHGAITRRNCHPFYADANRQVAVAHNGVLGVRDAVVPGVVAYLKDGWQYDGTVVMEVAKALRIKSLDKDSVRSDTRIFAERLIGNLDHNELWWQDENAVKDIERMLGSDRMALLTVADGIVRFNPHQFVEEDGIYYSNTMYKSWCTPRAGETEAPEDEAYGDWLRRRASAEAAARSAAARSSPLPVNPFAALDDDDFLIGYYIQPSGKDGAPVCLKCQPEKPDSSVNAVGLFNSDLHYCLTEKCAVCGALLDTIAQELFEAALVNDVVGGSCEPCEPCMICGYPLDECLCSVADYTAAAEAARKSDDPSDAPPVVKAAVTHVPTIAQIIANGQVGVVGLPNERFLSICKKIEARNGDLNTLTLFDAGEQYPDLFALVPQTA